MEQNQNSTFESILKEFKRVCPHYYAKGASSDHGTYIRTIQNNLGDEENVLNWIMSTIIEYKKKIESLEQEAKELKAKAKETNTEEDRAYADEAFEQINIAKSENLVEKVIDKFNKKFSSTDKVGSYTIYSLRSSLRVFSRYIIGQYKADTYITLDKYSEQDFCKLVAKNALFCTVAVAENVRTGALGSEINRKVKRNGKKGNDYYSWFCCCYQRRKVGQNKGDKFPFKSPGSHPSEQREYIIDDNTKANLAIKYAILEGFPDVIKENMTYSDFEDYMACHIWDKSCYDYRYHTSVFNIVLLPKAIGGLTDHNNAVKAILQYEAAKRFGVYPKDYNKCDFENKPKYYDELDALWRQPSEHEKAKNEPSPI